MLKKYPHDYLFDADKDGRCRTLFTIEDAERMQKEERERRQSFLKEQLCN